MATSFIPELLLKQRYNTSFEVLRGYDNHGHLTAPSGSYVSGSVYENTVWKAGTMLSLNAAGYVVVAPSGAGQWFALQNVADMSGNNGYRNQQNTTANRGDVVGCQYGIGMAATAIHAGVGSPGDVGVWDGSTLRFISPSSYSAAVHGAAVCRLEHADGTDTLKSLASAGASAGSKDTPSSVKAIIRFSIPLV